MSAVRDIRSQLKPAKALDPQTIATDTTTVGEIIDTHDFDGGFMVSILADVTDGTYTPLLEQSDDSGFSSSSVIADESLIGDVDSGQEADAALSTSKEVSNLGVVNQSGRYVRLSIVSASTSSGAVIAAIYHGSSEVAKISN